MHNKLNVGDGLTASF